MSQVKERGVRETYDRWHADRAAVDDLLIDLQNPWNRFVCANLSDIADKLVLEIACGRGQLTAHLASSGARVVGADYSLRAVTMTRDRLDSHGRAAVMMNADACHLPLADASVDVVISCETIEHTPAPKQALAEFYRVLKPGGRLILTFPSHLNMTGLYRLYLWARRRPYNSGVAIQPIEQPLMAFRVLATLKKHGFRVLSTSGLAHYFLWPGRPPQRVEWIERAHVMRTLLKPFALHFGVIAERS